MSNHPRSSCASIPECSFTSSAGSWWRSPGSRFPLGAEGADDDRRGFRVRAGARSDRGCHPPELGLARSRSVLLVAGGAIVLVVTVVVGMGPQAVDQARKVTSDVPQTVREFYDLPVVGGWLEDNDAATRADEAIEEVPGKISDRSVTRTVEGMVGGALSTVLVLAVTVAVLLDGEYLVAAIRRLVPHRWVNRGRDRTRVLHGDRPVLCRLAGCCRCSWVSSFSPCASSSAFRWRRWQPYGP